MSVTECSHDGRAGVIAALAVGCVLIASAAWAEPPSSDSPAVADEQEMTEVQFRAPVPDHKSGVVQLKAANRIAKKAAKRLEVRYDAAGVTSAQIEVEDGGTITVKAAPGVDPGWLEQIAIPNGRFRLGPIIGAGEHWTDVSAELPEAVEIRQSDTSLRAEDAYLWSHNRSELEGFLQTKQPSVGRAYVYPDGDGWRTLTAAESIFDHDNIEAAVFERAPTGAPFVELSLDAEGEQAVEFHSGDDQRWLAVIDGEAVATISRLGVHGEKKLPLRPPAHLEEEDAKQWAKLVAARLSAHIPVELVPDRVDE